MMTVFSLSVYIDRYKTTTRIKIENLLNNKKQAKPLQTFCVTRKKRNNYYTVGEGVTDRIDKVYSFSHANRIHFILSSI